MYKLLTYIEWVICGPYKQEKIRICWRSTYSAMSMRYALMMVGRRIFKCVQYAIAKKRTFFLHAFMGTCCMYTETYIKPILMRQGWWGWWGLKEFVLCFHFQPIRRNTQCLASDKNFNKTGNVLKYKLFQLLFIVYFGEKCCKNEAKDGKFKRHKRITLVNLIYIQITYSLFQFIFYLKLKQDTQP